MSVVVAVCYLRKGSDEEETKITRVSVCERRGGDGFVMFLVAVVASVGRMVAALFK